MVRTSEGQVPAVTEVRERRGKAKIFVDGEFWAELDAGVASERGLCEGAAFSCEELARVRVAGERPLAMSRALNILGYRARSAREMRERLSRARYAEETIDLVMERLEELEYLDDEGFAQETVRHNARKYGPRRIYADLRRSGVDEEVARESVDKEFSMRSEYELAIANARRRYNTDERSDAQARRVYGFLMRRGFSAAVCVEVAREYR